MLKHVLPPFVFSCIAAALLLAFALWRAIKLCTCARCIRGPQRRARAAADTLGARRHRLLQAGVGLLACGVVAGAGYGLSTIQPGLQPRGVDVFEQAKVCACLLGVGWLESASRQAVLPQLPGPVVLLRLLILPTVAWRCNGSAALLCTRQPLPLA